MQYKEIVVGIIIALLIVVGFTFRERIFRSALETPREDQGAESATTPSADQSGFSDDQAATSSSNNQSAPAYRGRPLDEVKFSPNILQSMGVSHKDQLSADIRKYAKMAKESPEYIAAWLQVALLKKAIEDYEGSRDIWI